MEHELVLVWEFLTLIIYEILIEQKKLFYDGMYSMIVMKITLGILPQKYIYQSFHIFQHFSPGTSSDGCFKFDFNSPR